MKAKTKNGNVKDLKGNKTKYQAIEQSGTPRTVWPWLTALILVVVNQYRVQTGKKPLQIDAEYVVEVKEKDGDMEVLYDSRGLG